jgi:hypothetical protein
MHHENGDDEVQLARDPFIFYLERYLLEPWLQFYDQPASNKGNIEQKNAWRPRKFALLYLLLLLALCYLFLFCCTFVEGSKLLKTAVCLLFFLNSGFAYINFVTTNRSHLFKGLFNDYREIILMNLLIPFIIYWGFLRYESTLFDIYSLELICFLASFIGGLHINYIVKIGHLDASMSTKLQNLPTSAYIAVIGKIVTIIGLCSTHIFWLLETGLFPYRISAYLSVFALIVYISRSISKRYYFHWHHWIAGLMLSPLCHANPAWWALVLQGVCLSQFVEGLARWSCAPLWHKLHT